MKPEGLAAEPFHKLLMKALQFRFFSTKAKDRTVAEALCAPPRVIVGPRRIRPAAGLLQKFRGGRRGAQPWEFRARSQSMVQHCTKGTHTEHSGVEFTLCRGVFSSSEDFNASLPKP